jgi:GNAT superfamily N-acetyltransferase
VVEEERSSYGSAGLGRFCGRVLRRVPPALLVHRDLAILRRDLTADPQAAAGVELAEHRVFTGGVLEVHRQLKREFREEVIRRRFERGLWFYALWGQGLPLASTWVVPRGERFVDEIGLGFRVGEGDVWMRDIFVAAESRGAGAFAALLDHILAGPFSGRRALWSAVYTDNRSSLRAHAKYGYRLVARFEVIHLLRRLMVRLRWPTPPPGGSSFRANHRLILTGQPYRRFTDDRRA